MFPHSTSAVELLSWLDAAEKGRIPIQIPPEIETNSFLTGGKSEDRIRLRLYRDGVAIAAKVWFGPGSQGPPGHAHGGSIAAVLDQVMGSAAWVVGHTVLAAELSVRFRRKLPLETLCVVDAKIESVEGRKVRTRGIVRGRDGTVFAEGQALFIEVDTSTLGELAQTAKTWLEPNP